jgi:hypothetical protein
MAISEELTFREMTFEILESQYGIHEGPRDVLFDEGLPDAPVSEALLEFLHRARHAVMVNERARAYRLVSPILSELEELRRVSRTPRLVPIAAIVEAKKDDTGRALLRRGCRPRPAPRAGERVSDPPRSRWLRFIPQ